MAYGTLAIVIVSDATPSGHLSFVLLGFATLRDVVFEEVNLEQLQVEFRVEEKHRK
jgi:hypothetical protein